MNIFTKRKPIKVMMSSALMAGIVTTAVIPTHAFAEQVNSNDSVQQINVSNESGLQGLANAVQQSKNSIAFMDTYAMTLNKQPVLDFTAETSEDKGINDRLKQDQNTAKTNARKWLDEIKPKLTKVSEDIVNHGATFSEYNNEAFKEAITNKDKDTIKEGVKLLQDDVQQKKKNIEDTIQTLKDFQGHLDEKGEPTGGLIKDAQNIGKDQQDLTKLLQVSGGSITVLNQQINAYYAKLDSFGKMACGGLVGTLAGVTLTGAGIALAENSGPVGALLIVPGIAGIAGGVSSLTAGLVEQEMARKDLKAAQDHLSILNQKIVGLTSVKGNVDVMSQQIDYAIQAFQSILNQWNDLESKYGTLSDDVNKLDPDHLFTLGKRLKTANDAWGNIQTLAKNMFQDFKYEEKTM
ncbi:hypothetical protein IIU_06001 [Bacillus cereus VD133]|uniref:Hemolysin BL lytic component L1 n=1 Tax=Bacillus cereus VD133 TaxID=1053233 RepID=A0A9W5UZR5_BACCE|nr:HBL/NHE enterotoxin family protein [Bacillus cereus]EOO26389.1 hypothetical protein IIU_06001 [Bacillus cereus VD133]